MLLRKKYRSKLIYLAIAIVIFLYWRGLTTTAHEKKWDLPNPWEILKTGARF